MGYNYYRNDKEAEILKRITAVMISAAITLSVAACAMAEQNDTRLEVENGTVTVTNAVENGTLILAFYNNGVLAGTDMRRGSGTITADVSGAPEGTDLIKAFYWDMTDIRPLGNVVYPPVNDMPSEDAEEDKVMIKIGDKEFAATFYDNDTAAALKNMFPLTLDMKELNGNEKYYYLPNSLPTDTESVGTINEGDIMLYGSDCLVVFYKTFSTPYSYTKIGHIDDVTGLSDAVGSGNVTVVFE